MKTPSNTNLSPSPLLGGVGGGPGAGGGLCPIGQTSVFDRLLLLDRENRIPHAMLFAGPQGIGKMALAMAFATHLLKKHDPYGNAEAMISRGSHPDLHFSYPVIRPAGTASEHKMDSDDFKDEWLEMIQRGMYFDMNQWLEAMGAGNQQAVIGVGESNALIKKLSLKSSQGGYKVSIIWQPERMNADCANKLLKLIEEPPAQTVFILVSEQPERLLETIRSRTQRIDIRPIDTEDMTQALIAQRSIEPAMARRIARSAAGSWFKALQILSADAENKDFLACFQQLMRYSFSKKVMELKQWTDEVYAFGREKQKRFLNYCLYMLRESFMYNLHKEELCYMTPDEEKFASKFAPFINEKNIIDFNSLFNRAVRDISQNANARIVFYDIALKTIILLRR